MACENGYSTVVEFIGSEFVGRIRDINISGIQRKAMDASYMGMAAAVNAGAGVCAKAYKRFVPSTLIDPGTVSLDMLFDTSAMPPITGESEDIVITYPDGTTDSFTGFVTDMGIRIPLDDLMTQTLTLKITGAIARS